MVMVNLGCGEIGLAGWINIDWTLNAKLRRNPFTRWLAYLLSRMDLMDTSTKWPPNLLLRDMRKGLPFKDDSVGFIYTSHSINCLKKYEAKYVLEECHRVLNKGGILRIVVPDLALFAKKYVNRESDFYDNTFKYRMDEDDTLADRFLKLLYPPENKNPIKGFWGKRGKLKYKLALIRETVSSPKWMYDFDSLSSMLYASGFKSVERKAFRVGRTPDIDKLDNRPAESLYVEAEK